jgi:hypothetical protein
MTTLKHSASVVAVTLLPCLVACEAAAETVGSVDISCTRKLGAGPRRGLAVIELSFHNTSTTAVATKADLLIIADNGARSDQGNVGFARINGGGTVQRSFEPFIDEQSVTASTPVLPQQCIITNIQVCDPALPPPNWPASTPYNPFTDGTCTSKAKLSFPLGSSSSTSGTTTDFASAWALGSGSYSYKLGPFTVTGSQLTTDDGANVTVTTKETWQDNYGTKKADRRQSAPISSLDFSTAHAYQPGGRPRWEVAVVSSKGVDQVREATDDSPSREEFLPRMSWQFSEEQAALNFVERLKALAKP